MSKIDDKKKETPEYDDEREQHAEVPLKERLMKRTIVEFRNGNLGICTGEHFVDMSSGEVFYLKDYLHDLTHVMYEGNDVMKFNHNTYAALSLKDWMWVRKDEIKLSKEEKEVLKALKVLGFKSIVRTLTGNLIAFSTEKLERSDFGNWWPPFGWLLGSMDQEKVNTIGLDKFKNKFAFIKNSDENPYIIDDLLKGN